MAEVGIEDTLRLSFVHAIRATITSSSASGHTPLA